ncbi:protein NODULATION SIGNALING PATHWAY 2-like [Dioscorea cayenensis subsp. rotundata]|uniref:Protein NODULATION SIGNALING PATHWAY 2-like n=1 Tax=Dioscorea cayennensis subsp. rotundata TaxID=55577 RepID=A0AB40BNZ2_DIOCR|nr:protein NODULATION SIGNALING PATHWAY 2-like [Dioscorea cayenensis subsp. rotundata]
MERLGHHLLHFDDHYLREESSKNYGMALRAFYEICPYGRFAHLATNFAILESLPCDVQVIHIIDFDVGEGEQWPALLAVLNHRISVKLSVIHCKEVKKTRNNLCSFACSIGLSLQVEEIEMEELLLMFDRTVNENEWFVFNCMVGLPHMGEPKRRRQVLEFTRVAEKVVTSYKGIGMISYGEGFGSRLKPFSDDHLVSSHALFESLEWHFPSHLSLARTTMECLFVGPCVSLIDFVEDFEPFCGHGLRECRVSKERLMEVKEMVMKGRDEPYEIKVNGYCENEMVLEWRGTPMVRLYTWR